MTQAVLNTQLYQKMFAEQAYFKDLLLTQTPEEVLNHAYEYTCREDILLSLEYNDLSPRQAKALLKSPHRWRMYSKSGIAGKTVTTWKISGMPWKPVPMKWYGLILLPKKMRGDLLWHSSRRKPSKRPGRWTC